MRAFCLVRVGLAALVAATGLGCTAAPAPSSREQLGHVAQAVQPTLWREAQKVPSPEPVLRGIGDSFGAAVALSGDTAMIGAPLEDIDINEGCVYVFERGKQGFGNTQKLQAASPALSQNFGHQLALQDTTAFISGAFPQTGTRRGVVYVFEHGADGWVQVQELGSPAEFSGVRFGNSIALAGDTLIVGAPSEGSGAAYVFARGETEWTLAQRLVVEDAAAADHVGREVALSPSGDVAFVTSQTKLGYVFQRKGGTWSLLQSLTPDTPDTGPWFGSSPVMSETEVLVTVANGAGDQSIFDFTRDGEDWTEAGILGIGRALVMHGDTLMALAKSDNPDEATPGGLYQYQRVKGSWSQIQRLAAADTADADQFGSAVAFEEATAVVGAPRHFVAVTDALPSGSAYVFQGGLSAMAEPCSGDQECFSDHCVDGFCCESACEGQCQACGEPGNEGSCVPIEGQPRSAREPCSLGDGNDPCTGLRCDGKSEGCEAFVGEEVECRAAECGDGFATLAAVCEGTGICPELAEMRCGSFACQADHCGEAPCETDADCAAGFRCQDSDCVALGDPVCSDDRTTQLNPDSTERLCSPYLCAEGSCLLRCHDTTECADGYVCEESSQTCALSRKAPADDPSCSCRAVGRRDGSATMSWGLAALVALLGWRRRRRAAWLAAGVLVGCTPAGEVSERLDLTRSAASTTGLLWREEQRVENPYPDAIAMGGELKLVGSTALVRSEQGDINSGVSKTTLLSRKSKEWTVTQELVPSDMSDVSIYGKGLALSENVAVVIGQTGDPNVATTSFAAVFERVNDAWTEQQRLLVHEPSEFAAFGSGLAVADSTLLLSVIDQDVGQIKRSGAVQIFERQADGWQFVQQLTSPNPVSFGTFGQAVAISETEDTAFVGDSVGGYILARDDASFVVKDTLELERPGDERKGSARSAAFSGERLLVGHFPSAASIFVLSGGHWQVEQRLSTKVTADNFGAQVGLFGDTAMVAAPGADVDGVNKDQGLVYVYTRAGEVWTEQQQLRGNDSARAIDGFGQTLALGDGFALISSNTPGKTAVGPGSERRLGLFSFGFGYLPDGAECDGDDACHSSHCADRVCCETACDAQCQACAEPDHEGTCLAVLGEPRGTRQACPAPADEPCAARLCDGQTPDSCEAFVGGEVSCREASCSDGLATLEASCVLGVCPKATRLKCGNYACDGSACGKSCSSDADCSGDFRCVDTACVAPEGTACSSDGLSEIDEDGASHPCTPYVCAGVTCLSECVSTADCVGETACNPDNHHCEARPGGASEAGSCDCQVPAPHPSGHSPTWLIGLAFALRWRRRHALPSARR